MAYIFLMKKAKNKNKPKRGFTLLEILLVVALIAILAGILIFAINPAQRFAEARNAQRQVDINAIASAIYQYSVDNNGALPDSIPEGDCPLSDNEICQTDIGCGAVDLSVLTSGQKYLTSMPMDPSWEANYNADGTGYMTSKSANGRITVCAPLADLGITISVTK